MTAERGEEINKLRRSDLTDAETQKINDLRAEVDRLQAAIEPKNAWALCPPARLPAAWILQPSA